MISSPKVWVASHLSGIFEIVDQNDDLLLRGSRGAGFSINRGVTTWIEPNSKNKLEVYFDNKPQLITDAFITTTVLRLFDPSLLDQPFTIYHSFDVPIGGGFGASAASAVGCAFAVNTAFNYNKSDLELWQIAHKTEILCKTGLGDVIGLYQGGVERRIHPGAPGIGKTTSLHLPKETYTLLTLRLGRLLTSEILRKPELKSTINKAAQKTLAMLDQFPSFENFLKQSQQFTVTSGLATKEVLHIIHKLSEKGIDAAQIMLGTSLFALVPESFDIPTILKELELKDIQYNIEKIAYKTVIINK